jgi:hypothetical protein
MCLCMISFLGKLETKRGIGMKYHAISQHVPCALILWFYDWYDCISHRTGTMASAWALPMPFVALSHIRPSLSRYLLFWQQSHAQLNASTEDYSQDVLLNSPLALHKQSTIIPPPKHLSILVSFKPPLSTQYEHTFSSTSDPAHHQPVRKQVRQAFIKQANNCIVLYSCCLSDHWRTIWWLEQ